MGCPKGTVCMRKGWVAPQTEWGGGNHGSTLSGSRVGTACTTNKLALFSLCCGQRTAAVSPPGLLTDRSGTTSNEPGKSTIHTSEEMEGLLKAIQDLESSLGNAKNEAVMV